MHHHDHHHRDNNSAGSSSRVPMEAGARSSSESLPTTDFSVLAQTAIKEVVGSIPGSPLSKSFVDEDDDEDEAEQRRLEALWKGGAAPTKPYKHLHIDWPNASIKKVLTIGASAQDAHPPVYDRPEAQTEESTSASCVLITKSSPINATVHIVREAKDRGISSSSSPASPRTSAALTMGKPILVSAKTGSVGSIILSIPQYTGTRPLHIRAKANNGNITIYLPPTFAGLLNWSSETGTLRLSHNMQQRFKLLDPKPHKHRGTAKIVPGSASGNRGDACQITNRHGSITIKEYGEDGKSSGSGKDDKGCLIQ